MQMFQVHAVVAFSAYTLALGMADLSKRTSLSKDFTKRGFVYPVRVFSEAETKELREFLDKLEAQVPEGRFPAQAMNLHLQHQEVWKFIRHSLLREVAAEVSGQLNTSLHVMATAIITKYPAPLGKEATGAVGWHQDLAYWNLAPQEAFTTWVALEPVTEENGCMHMMPNMHLKGLLEHQKQGADADNILMNKQAIPEHLLGTGDGECIALDAGEVSVHGGWTPHMSRPNFSRNRRMGIVVNWIPSHIVVGSLLYENEAEWRLPVDPSDDAFPPRILQKPKKGCHSEF